MSKTTDSINSDKVMKMPVGSATFYNEKKSSPAPVRPTKTPPKFYEVKKLAQPEAKKMIGKNLPDLKKKQPFKDGNIYSAAFHDIAMQEKDERFKYLLKHGQLRKIQKGGNIIFSQLPQIPNIWVCYRRPVQRQASFDKLNLDDIELNHLPLLEGQEKLKMLTFQHNKINRLENLISLPNLLYLDLYDNNIREIQNLSVLTNLKVLLLPKNNINKIKSINELTKLEVLDLHSNKISKIQGFGMLNALRIVNLANNQISKIQNLDYLQNLTQLNLKLNTISQIENIKHLSKMQKLYLANNRIEIKAFQLCQLVKLFLLKQLTLENNPCSKIRSEYMKNIIKYLPFVKTVDGKPPTLQNSQPETEDEEDHSEVLKLIATQWQEEKKRLMALEKTGAAKRDFLKGSVITGGHAEIEDESILFIYGNSYDVVLNNQTFQDTVEKIRFEYIFFEFLIENNILQMIKKFKKLKVIEFKNNYITSLLQIAKLQNLNTLKTILIEPEDNPVAHCSFLKQFIVYRFPNIVQVNKDDIKETDRQKAKQLFHHFDRVLQIPQKFYNPQNLKVYPSEDPESKKDRTYLKTFNKILNEAAETIVTDLTARATMQLDIKQQLDKAFQQAVIDIIAKVETK